MILQLTTYLNYFLHKRKLKQLKLKFKGENVKILPGFNWGHLENLMIHSNVLIGMNSFINAHGGVEIKSGTVTGPDLMIFSVNHIYDQSEFIPFSNELDYGRVTIEKNCWIGGRVFICPGVTLGEGCIVAGGSVITKSFPNGSVIGGNPAKIIKERSPDNYRHLSKNGIFCNDILR